MSAAELVLSKSEVRALCRTPIKARQVAFLVRNGIAHYVDAHGWPIVLRATLAGDRSAKPQRPWKSNKVA